MDDFDMMSLDLSGSLDQAIVLPAHPAVGDLQRDLRAAGLDLDRRGDRLVAINPSFAFGLAFEAFGFSGDWEAFTVEYR